jgi:hypothetical protein
MTKPNQPQAGREAISQSSFAIDITRPAWLSFRRQLVQTNAIPTTSTQ